MTSTVWVQLQLNFQHALARTGPPGMKSTLQCPWTARHTLSALAHSRGASHDRTTVLTDPADHHDHDAGGLTISMGFLFSGLFIPRTIIPGFWLFAYYAVSPG